MRRIACIAFCLFLAGAASAAEKSPDELLDAAIDYAKTHKQPLPKLVSFCKKLIRAGRLVRAENVVVLIARRDLPAAKRLILAIEKCPTILGKWQFNTGDTRHGPIRCLPRGKVVIGSWPKYYPWGTWKRAGKASYRLQWKSRRGAFVVKVRGKVAEGTWKKHRNRDFRSAAIRGKRIQ